jgi:hypothetical protein
MVEGSADRPEIAQLAADRQALRVERLRGLELAQVEGDRAQIVQ